MAHFDKTAFLVEIEDYLHEESNASIHTKWNTIERDVRLAARLINAGFVYLDQVSFGPRPEYEYRIYMDDMNEPPVLIYKIQELPLVK